MTIRNGVISDRIQVNRPVISAAIRLVIAFVTEVITPRTPLPIACTVSFVPPRARRER